MSKQVDERVVSMQFDNSRFESNVKTSMSTLDKLKEKLSFKGASKGLEEVNRSAGKVNMSGLGSGVEAVTAKFSALQVMGVTALANLTNSAVNAGKRIVSALTIDPIKTGFSEYELKMDSVKTIMASTGEEVETVNKYLKELNEYSDQTIYSFADMTQNIGKFTNAGVGLEDAVLAIKGISNEAAVSGANANEASRAMYNFAQALSSGYVKLIDWKSIENANMATVEFKQHLLDAAVAAGTLRQAQDGVYYTQKGNLLNATKDFNDTLQDQWMTSEVLINTLKDYADPATEIGKKAYAAAQDVTKLTQVFDILKETAQSGWAETWEILFGDIEAAKAIFTPLTNFLSGFIQAIDDTRNKILRLALYNPFSDMINTVNTMTLKTKEMLAPLEDYSDIVRRIIRGEFGNQGDEGDRDYRKKRVEAAGYDYAHAQNLVNEKLGSSVRHTSAYTEALKNRNKVESHTIEQLAAMSDEELKNLGYKDDQIKALRELSEHAKSAGMSLSDFIETTNEKLSGREMLVKTFENIGKGLATVFSSIKDAWNDVFPASVEKIAMGIYGAIAKLYNLSKSWDISKDSYTIDNLTRSFKGLFALIDIILTVVGGPIKIVLKAFTQLLSVLNIDVLWLTAHIGDAIVMFRDWLDSVLDFTKVFEWLVPHIKNAAAAIKDWVAASGAIQKVSKFFSDAFARLKDWVSGLKGVENIPKYIFQGLIKGIINGIATIIPFVKNIGQTIIDVVCKVLGIHSPSVAFIAIGGFIMAGLLIGIKNWFPEIWSTLENFGMTCLDKLKQIDWGAVLTSAMSVMMMVTMNRVSSAISSFAEMFEGLGEGLLQAGIGVKRALTGMGKAFRGMNRYLTGKAILQFAFAIGVLAASVFVLSLVDTKKLWNAVLAIGALAAIMIALTIALQKINIKDALQVGKLSLVLVAVSLSLLLLASALKKLSGLSWKEFAVGGTALFVLGGFIAGLVFLSKLASANVKAIGAGLLKMSAALLLLVIVMKLIARMEPEDIAKGYIVITLFGGFIVALMAATKLLTRSTNVAKVGGMLMKIAGAMLIMALVLRIVGNMEVNTIKTGMTVIAGFTAIIVGLMAATKLILGAKGMGKIGGVIFGIGAAMLLMALTMKLVGNMDAASITKGLAAIGAFGLIIAGLMYMTKFAGNKLKGLGITLLLVSVAIGLLAGISVLLGLMKVEHLAKGIVAMGLLAGMMAVLIMATKHAKDCRSNLVVMAVAIAVMAGSVALLSLIDPEKIAVGTAAMSSMIGMFAVMMLASQYLKSGEKTWKRNLATIGAMTLVVAALAGILVLMSKWGSADTMLPMAASISMLLLAMGGAMIVLSKVSINIKSALTGILALTAMAIPLMAFVAVLHFMPDVTKSTDNVKLLVPLMLAMTLLLIPLTLIGVLFYPALLGIVALTAMAIPLMAFVAVLHFMPDVTGAQGNVDLLIGLMNSLTNMLIKLAPLAPLAIIGVAALYALVPLMVTFGALAASIGALVTWFPSLQTFLNSGIPIMIQLAEGLGAVMGAFIAGFVGEVLTILPDLGANLSLFMTNATPFIEGAKNVDEKVLTGIAILAGAVAALTAVDLLENVVKFLNGGESFSTLGTELSNFMINALPFITTAMTLNPKMMSGVKTLVEAILILTGANLLENITSWLGGESSLASFGSQLGQFGTDLKNFVNNLGTFTEDQVKTVDCAGRAIKALAEAAKTLPNEGGWAAKILGENSISTFGSYLPQLATDMKLFVTNLGTFDEKQVTSVDCAGRAIKALAEAAKELPNEGGWAAKILGENSIATFGSYLPQLATDISGFITNLGTFDDSSIKTVDCACSAIKSLAEAAKAIPNEGGFWAKIVGDNSLATFGEKLPGLATNITSFVTNLGTFGDDQIATVNGACDIIRTITNLGKLNLGDTSTGLDNVGKKLTAFAQNIVAFANEMSVVSYPAISDARLKVQQIIGIVKDATAVSVDSLNGFTESLKNLATDGITAFIDALSSSDPITKTTKAAEALMAAVITGIGNKKDKVTDKAEDVAEDTIDKFDSKSMIRDAETAGKNVVAGFARGIKNNKKLATDAGTALGRAALDAAMEALDEHSPSREMYKVGDYAGRGFVNALYDYVTTAYSAGREMGNSVKTGLSGAIAKITDVINNDMDSQPTIRPVLDLSDIRSGVNSIGSMFTGRTIAVNTASAGVVSASMAEFQNGRNSNDIVSNLKGLRKDIANMPRDVYQINGVTYDDGSNVSDAVKVLVRAAKIERRT